jgi:hypothetical protein
MLVTSLLNPTLTTHTPQPSVNGFTIQSQTQSRTQSQSRSRSRAQTRRLPNLSTKMEPKIFLSATTFGQIVSQRMNDNFEKKVKCRWRKGVQSPLSISVKLLTVIRNVKPHTTFRKTDFPKICPPLRRTSVKMSSRKTEASGRLNFHPEVVKASCRC